MPLDFPSSPANGQYYNGFVWNDANQTWDSAYAPRAATIPLAGTNAIINGAFDIWQRGTSFNIGSGIYCADRWQTTTTGGINVLVTKDTSVPSPQVQASLKFAPSANGTPGEYALRQFIEQQQVVGLAGKSVTLSFWYKSTKTTHKARVGTQTATGGTDVTQTFTVVPDTWTKISLTFSTFSAITAWTGSMSGAGAYVDIGFANSTAMTTSDNFYVAGVQLEEGAASTDFRRNAPSIAGELAACQRYYWRWYAGTTNSNAAIGISESTSTHSFFVQTPVEMRVVPTALESSGLSVARPGLTNTNVVNISINSGSKYVGWVLVTGTTAGSSQGQGVFLQGANTSAYLGFTAEL